MKITGSKPISIPFDLLFLLVLLVLIAFKPNQSQVKMIWLESWMDRLDYRNNNDNNNNFVQSFQDETMKKKEKMCEIGFWLSILGLVCSFFGIAYGIFVYIMDFYFASQGLKTRKKGKAIATIVLSIISILIIIFTLIIANS